MSFRFWVYVFAIIGLTGSSALGQTDQHTESVQGQADQQQRPTQVIPIPLPVEIVTDQAESDASKSGEEEAKQREIADLVAQEGMNASTKAIKDATNDMRDYALYSTIAVWVGTALLLYTLVLTRKANTLLTEVDRPWVLFDRIEVQPGMVRDKETGKVEQGITVQVLTKNYGKSPAIDVRCITEFQFGTRDDPPDLESRPQFEDVSAVAVGPSQYGPGTLFAFSDDLPAKVLSGETLIFGRTLVEYRASGSSKIRITESCSSFSISADVDEMSGTIKGFHV